MKRARAYTEMVWLTLMRGALLCVLLALFSLVGMVVWNGLPAISWRMLTDIPHGGFYLGGAGGIANAIVGSLLLASGATVLALFIGIPIALAMQREYFSPTALRCITLCFDMLWGIPSIVYGAVAFSIMALLGIGASLLGGILTLTVLVIPIIVRALNGVFALVPSELKEASLALGATRFETMTRVVFRQCLPGCATAVMLAFGRAIGDAASILFPAGYTDHMPRSLMDPVASLPLAIFFQLQTPLPAVQQRAYAAALILLTLVLVTSALARIASHRFSRVVLR